MKKYLLFIMLGLANLGISQDFHFSQSDIFNLTRHALSLEKESAKAIVAYRSQWHGASSFRNIFTSYHHQLSDFTMGGKLIQNDAGENSLKNTQFLFDLNYRRILNNSDDYIALGASVGLLQQRFKPESFKFDLQYVDGEGFNDVLSNGEVFNSNNQVVPIVNAGLQLKKHFDGLAISIGAAANHLNRPSFSFIDDEAIQISIEFSSFAKAEIQLKDVMFLEPYLMYYRFNFSEWMFGSRLKYEYNDDFLLNFGLAHRLNNSIITEAGINFQQFNFILSYDFLYKDISTVNGQIGNFELSVGYLFD